MKKNPWAATITATILGLLVLPAFPQNAIQTDLSSVDLVKKVRPAVVFIKVLTDSGVAAGSGFIVDKSGTIVTNLHVIRDAKELAVRLTSGDIFETVEILGFDERRDLAILQIPGFDLPVVELGNSNNIEIGSRVFLIGNPLGEDILEGSVSAGIVSGIRRMDDGVQMIQTDAAANPGNSGGPMVDSEGKVIGVLTLKITDAENLNFAIPINYARGLLDTNSRMSLSELQAKLGKKPNLFSEEQDKFPTRWKSLTDGTTWVLRVEGEHLYAEMDGEYSILSDNLAKVFTLIDLRKQGSNYVGTVRAEFVCGWVPKLYWVQPTQKFNRCQEKGPAMITSFTAERIEGWVDEIVKYDCGKCRAKKTEKATFVWIPD